MSNPTRKLQLGGGTLTGQLNFSGTNHAGIKLISLTTTQRDALTPANGMVIYNTTNARAEQYTSGAWLPVNSSTSTLRLYADGYSSPFALPNAAGANSIAIGDYAQTNSTGAVAIGYQSQGYGSYAIAIGAGAATGASSICLFGNAGGINSVGIRGSGVGDYSIALGGYSEASYSIAVGYFGRPTVSGKMHFAVEAFDTANVPDNGSGKFVVIKETTDGTQAELKCQAGAVAFSGGATATGLTLPNNATLAFSILVVARRTDADGENDAWEFKGLIHRDANAASTTLDALQANQIGATAWSVAVDADATNGSLRVRATGENSKTIRWCATIYTTEVSE